MSNLHAATKVADQVLSMLFDHKQFTSGEINHVIKSLDDMHLEENLEKLLRAQENVCRMEDQLQLKVDQAAASDIIGKLSSLDEMATKTLKMEEVYREKEEKMLKPLREERATAMRESRERSAGKTEANASRLKQEELELERKYREMEDKLRQSMR